ncbi:diacylglycerol kinase [Acetobacterium paludosum]|uniref:Diacylglycerol kinase n=1 Tax=Acetobacterium paludosum TaxID=52693 RepID=A0A923KR56_9FIRM|nr:diacylglycerol kinase family protein [Acetobacterium paludosum]MBC3889819.1 diacylglycerol kinase [Acetobacterium paludosum]
MGKIRRKLTKSFSYAIDGIKYTIKSQPNMRIHLGVGTIAIAAGIAFRIASYEWLALVIVIFFVFILEILNTAIETLVDLYTEDYHHLAKVAKDTAAGAVMVAAIMSVCVGLIIFLPKIVNWFF